MEVNCTIFKITSQLLSIVFSLKVFFIDFSLFHRMEFVKNTIASNPVVVFGKSYCPYCIKAVRYLSLTGCKFENINLDK